MSDSPYYDQIYAYLNDELSAEDRRAFEAAVQSDPDLAAELDFQRRLQAAAEQHAAQSQARDIMAKLNSKGLIDQALRQAEEARRLLESAGGDPARVEKLLREHPALADWKAVDPEGFEIDYLDGLQNPEERTIRLPTDKGWVFWKARHIIRLEEVDAKTLFFNDEGKKVLVAKTIRAAQEMLPDSLFYRCHKFHIINRNYIVEVLREGSGYNVILKGGVKIPISRRGHAAFISWLSEG